MLYGIRRLAAPAVVALCAAAVWVGGAMCAISGADNETGPDERVRVQSIVGRAEVVSPTGEEAKPVRVGMRVLLGWNVRTGPESWVELVFESGTVLRIGESSVVTLSDKTVNTQGLSMPVKRKDTL